MKILNFGSCNIDYVYGVPHFAAAGETIKSGTRTLFPGGKGLNQSLAMARAGLSLSHAGAIGKDGLFLSEMLRKAGVEVCSLMCREDVPTGHAVIQVDGEGHNCIIVCGGANDTVTKDEIETVLAGFSAGDIVVLQNEISHIDTLIETAAKRKMRIFFNPSPFEEALKSLDLGKLDTLIVNEVEAEAFSGESTISGVMRYFRAEYPTLRVLMTLGARGSVWFDAEKEVYCPAFSIEVVDTTSAGDTFTGYYISGIVQGRDVESSLSLASAASAISVSRHGAAASIPYADEVRQALRTLTPGPSPYNDSKKQAVNELIDSQLREVTLSSVAALLGYSESHTTVWFRREMGSSFTALLHERRCRRAAELLQTSELSIDRIVEACGYQNGGFFRKKFKEHYGMAPLAYRKQKRGEKS